jgi:hypothetical protein
MVLLVEVALELTQVRLITAYRQSKEIWAVVTEQTQVKELVLMQPLELLILVAVVAVALKVTPIQYTQPPLVEVVLLE